MPRVTHFEIPADNPERAVKSDPAGLDVQWHHIADARPGAHGHAGHCWIGQRNSRRYTSSLGDIAVVTPLK